MPLAVMHDQRELIQPLIVGDEAVWTVKRIIVLCAVNLQGGAH